MFNEEILAKIETTLNQLNDPSLFDAKNEAMRPAFFQRVHMQNLLHSQKCASQRRIHPHSLRAMERKRTAFGVLTKAKLKKAARPKKPRIGRNRKKFS